MTIFSWILTALSIIGALRNAQEKIDGFYIWIVANIGWIIYDVITNQPAQIALFAVYTAISIFGVYQWIKNRKKKIKE